MRLLLLSITFIAGALVQGAVTCSAQNDALSVSKLLPAETQGCVRVVDLPRFIERWNKTQLGLLGNDERLKPFWDEQRAEIQKRFTDAGWQLNLQADDLYEISTGQAAVAWVSQPQNAQRPYAVCLVMDIDGKNAEAKALLDKADVELKKRGATAQDSQVAGTAVRQYTLRRQPGDTVIRSTFYSLTDKQLYATDDLSLLSNLIDANTSGGNHNPLASEAIYQSSIESLDAKITDYDLEYFVRPIGLAKAMRFISGRAAAGQTDILKVLENQGFGKISAVAGRVEVGTEKYDMIHEAFVVAQRPLPEAVQILDFPNSATTDVPSWVSPESSTFTSLAWNAKEAFWKVRSIVDEIAGQAGTFDSVIEGIQTDPLGPRIDIRNEVLPFLTNQIFVMTDTVLPITVNSRRALVAIQVNDPDNTLKAVLDRAMENEPDAIVEDYRDVRIWKVSREDETYAADLDTDFGDFGATTGDEEPDTDDSPLLNNWAIAKFDGYLVFASHADLIREVLDRAKLPVENSPFVDQDDVAKVLAELDAIAGDDERCAWRVVRSDRSFEMQYELFRTDQLPDNQSILAVLLDRILKPRATAVVNDQQVKGNKLPEFEQVRGYLMPLGVGAKSTEKGWAIKNFVLAKEKLEEAEASKQANAEAASPKR